MSKTDCWIALACGREPGGVRVNELGHCPAATDPEFDNVNGGTNAGRFCWAITGTLCGGRVQGSFAQKQLSCLSCKFFLSVKAEEGSAFVLKPESAKS